MIQAQKVDADRGVAWISDGFRNFMTNPGLWVVIGLITIAIFIVLAVVPFIGGLAAALLWPVLTAGMLYAAREADAGRPIEVGHLFRAFQDNRALNGLLALGGIVIAGTILSMIIMFFSLGGLFVAGMRGASAAVGAWGIGTLVGLLVVVTIQFAVAAAVVYAIPLVMFKNASVGEAMSASINACVAAFLPLLIFGVIYLVLAVIASIPFGLGWIVLTPVSAAMLYASYRDIFGA
jgi:uncharacterized membrane protein